MAVSFVAASSGTSGSATSASFATTLPAGWAAGDVAILVGHVSAATLTMTTPAGWTAIPGITNPTSEGSNSRIYAWYRVLQAGDTAPTITNSGSVIGGWDMAVYRGADQASSIGQAAAGTAAVTSRALPSLTGVAAGSALHAFAHARVATGTIPTGLNWAAAYTESLDVATSRATSAANVRLANGRQVVSAAGNYGGETVTVANTISSSMIVGLVEIKAAAPTPSTVALTPAVITLTASAVTATAGGAGTPPVPVATYSLATQVGDSALVTPSFTPSEGEIIVVKLLDEAEGTQSAGGPSGGGLTFTRQQLINVAGQALAALWTATVGPSPSAMTITVPALTTHPNWSALVERWPAGTTLGAVALAAGATGSGAPLASLTTTAPNSTLSWAVGDWNAVAPGTPVYRDSAVQEAVHDRSPNNYVGYFAYQAEPAAGSHDFGLTSPAGQKWSAVGVEIKAVPSGGGPATVTLTPATLTLSAVPVTPVPQPVPVTLSPTSFTLTAVPVSPAPKPVTVTLTPAVFTLTAVPVTPEPVSATPSVTLAPAQFTLAAVPVTPVPRAVNRTLIPAQFTLTAIPVVAEPLPVTVPLTPAAITLAGVPVQPVPQPVTVELTPALFTLDAVPVDAAPSPVVVAAHSVSIRQPAHSVTAPSPPTRVTVAGAPASVRRTR